MDVASLYQSGDGQAVRLPKGYHLEGAAVAIKHYGSGVLLMPLDDPWSVLEEGLKAFEPGFVIERQQPET